MRRLLALSTVVLGLALQAGNAQASAFRVTPIQVELSGRTSSLLTLTNESTEILRFQIKTFSWNQSLTGEMQLNPTEDISFFPTLVSLKPGEERKVRVGSNVVAGEVEKTYRIFFEELPPEEKPAGEKRSEVRILTKMGIPIFVVPFKSTAEAKVADLKMDNGRLSFSVTNEGNAHFTLRGLDVSGIGAAGEKVLDRHLDGWYVLGKSRRDYSIEIPQDVCSKLKTVKIDARTDITTVSGATTVSSEQTFSGTTPCRKQ